LNRERDGDRGDLPFFRERPTLNVVISFGQLVQLGLQVHILIGHIELAGGRFDVGLDVRDAGNLFQIASDRSGTARSRHARELKDDELRSGGGSGLAGGGGRVGGGPATAGQGGSCYRGEEKTAMHELGLQE
jgi:hypothetical protein